MDAWSEAGGAEGGRGHPDGLWARTATLLLGGWLAVSAFAWERAGPARTNAGVVAYLVFVFALLTAAGLERGRRANLLLGLWLAASAWVIPPTAAAMRWNTVLVGLLVAGLSRVTRQGRLTLPPLRRRAPA